MGRDTQSKGKLAELKVIGELVRAGYTSIYTPVIDIEGIDILVKRDDGTYAEIQVKSRSRDDSLFQVNNLQKNPNRYIILHVLDTDHFYIMPAKDFVKLSYKNSERGYSLSMTKYVNKELRKYRNDWDRLNEKEFEEEDFAIKKENKMNEKNAYKDKNSRPRISEPHFKSKDFEPMVLELLKQKSPLTRKEIVSYIYGQVKDKLSKADKEKLSKGAERWETAVRWAVLNLKNENKIKSIGKNQWVLA